RRRRRRGESAHYAHGYRYAQRGRSRRKQQFYDHPGDPGLEERGIQRAGRGGRPFYGKRRAAWGCASIIRVGCNRDFGIFGENIVKQTTRQEVPVGTAACATLRTCLPALMAAVIVAATALFAPPAWFEADAKSPRTVTLGLSKATAAVKVPFGKSEMIRTD